MNGRYSVATVMGVNQTSALLIDLENEYSIDDTFSWQKIYNGDSKFNNITDLVLTIRSTINGLYSEDISVIRNAIACPFDYEKVIDLFKGLYKFDILNSLNIDIFLIELFEVVEPFTLRFMNDVTSLAVLESWVGKSVFFFKSVTINLDKFIDLWLKRSNADCIVIGGNVEEVNYLFALILGNELGIQDVKTVMKLSGLIEITSL